MLNWDNQLMTYHVNWTKPALEKKKLLEAKDPSLKAFIAATVEALVNGQIGVPKESDHHEVKIEFTNFVLVLETTTDTTIKVKFVDITDVKPGG